MTGCSRAPSCWETAHEFFGASVTPGVGAARLVDGAALNNELCDPAVTFSPAPEGMIVLCKGAVGRAAKSMAVRDQGGVGMILYNDFPNQTLPSDNHFVPTVHVTNADGLAIKAYIAAAAAPDPESMPRRNSTKGWPCREPVRSWPISPRGARSEARARRTSSSRT